MPVRFWYILQQDIIIASRNSTSGLQISENRTDIADTIIMYGTVVTFSELVCCIQNLNHSLRRDW